MTTATVKSQKYAIVDTDVHHMYSSVDALVPYLPGIDPARLFVPKGDGGNPRGGLMKSAMPPGGGVAGSDARFFAEDHLDRHGIALAILNPGTPLGLGGVPDLDLAAAVARATNDWTINDRSINDGANNDWATNDCAIEDCAVEHLLADPQ